MARTDDDTWEITESENPLISNPCARVRELMAELTAGYDRRPPQDIDDAAPQTLFGSAQRTGKGE